MKKFLVYLFILYLHLSICLKAQVVLNEICSTNNTVLADEDSKYPDWIELYNNSSVSVNLNNYTINYVEEGVSIDWKFPDINIPAYSYLTIFASGKNRRSVVDHWEIPVYAANTWKYFVGISEPPANWTSPSFNDLAWQQGVGPIGYGDGDDATVIPPTVSLYMRKSFFVPDTSKFTSGILLMDIDDGMVIYLNDKEVGRFNVGTKGIKPSFNTMAYEEHEAKKYQSGNFTWGAFLAEGLIDSSLIQGWNTFSVQTHNFSDGLDDLTCDANLLLGSKDNSVTFPSVPADVPLHTNFTLSSTKPVSLTLKNSAGIILDKIELQGMQTDNSWGRSPDASGTFCYFKTPTPDSSNNNSLCNTGYSSTPYFSVSPGFYSNSQTVAILLNGTSNGAIRYTTDGSEPTVSSLLYTSPLLLSGTSVLRAIHVGGGMLLPSATVSGTYFINESNTLPVISLTTDSVNLFDYYNGIYVLGPNADTTKIPFYGANFWMGWSRPAHVEFFEKDKKTAFTQDVSIQIQGNWSKAWPQRGFEIKAKDDFNDAWINYKLFPDKSSNKYKNFNIRNAGSDWNTCHFRDRLMQKTVHGKTAIDIMDGRPATLYINGKYWGVYEIREKQDEYYIANNHNVNPDSIDLLRYDGDVMKGSNIPFFDMVTYTTSNDITQTAVYDSVQKLLDINNFVDYFSAETYYANVDWLGTYTNNIKYWRSHMPGGKWRYILWDTDLSMGLFQPFTNNSDTSNSLKTAINPPVWNPHSAMLNKLLQNEQFKKYFINRYADLINTIWHPTYFNFKVDQIVNEMYPEMEKHFTRWGYQSPAPGVIGSANNVPEWFDNIDKLKNFINNRPKFARNHIESIFQLTKQVDVTLKTEPFNAGDISINTIQPELLPWKGVYFDGNPINITAKPKQGYKFLYWKSAKLMLLPVYTSSIELNVAISDEFTAYFEEIDYDFYAFPNPFSDKINIYFSIPANEQVSIKMTDVSGRLVKDFLNYTRIASEGEHTIEFDASSINLNQGIYFISMKTTTFSKTIKLVFTGNIK